MRYSQIRSMDISNGEGVGVSLFVQGCPIHCKNCFNSDTWDFNGGKKWTEKIKNDFLSLLDKPYITRCSFLGGEPLALQNVNEIYNIICNIHCNFPEKKIWLYTGYKLEDIYDLTYKEMFNKFNEDDFKKVYEANELRKKAISMCNILVDGQYIDDLKDQKLKFCGSKNQRVIDVKKTFSQKKIVLYCN